MDSRCIIRQFIPGYDHANNFPRGVASGLQVRPPATLTAVQRRSEKEISPSRYNGSILCLWHNCTEFRPSTKPHPLSHEPPSTPPNGTLS